MESPEKKTATSRVSVSKAMLEWAIARRGHATKLRKRFPNLEKWLNGSVLPTFNQLMDFATATATPFGYFFLKEPPAEDSPIPHYRSVKDLAPSKPSPELLDTIRIMQRRQDWLREHLEKVGSEPLAFVGSATLKNKPEEVAHSIRAILNLQHGWASKVPNWEEAIETLLSAAENVGIYVASNGIVGSNTHRKLLVDEFRGFVLVDRHAPIIFINNSDGKAAQMFTIAHELAHIFYGASASFDLKELQPSDEPLEKACNQVAAEFLVPSKELRSVWDQLRSAPNRFKAISRNFKVSEIVAARRAQDLGLINYDEFIQFWEAYSNQLRRLAAKRSKGGDFYANANQRVGRLFSEAVFRAVGEGRLLYSDAYRLTGLHGAAFRKFAEYQQSPANRRNKGSLK